MGRNWARLGGENSGSKGFWWRWQANGCFRRCRGEGFCAGGMVARQTAPGCTRCVQTEKGSARTKRARAEEPRTGVYVIRTWNVRGTRRTGCNMAQGSLFADVCNACANPGCINSHWASISDHFTHQEGNLLLSPKIFTVVDFCTSR